MTDRDLTPDEARAEIEAFMGDGWRHHVVKSEKARWVSILVTRKDLDLFGAGPTYRAAVDALKAAWRDAVRPWVCVALQDGYTAGVNGVSMHSKSEMVARVLKEDSK